MPFYGDVSFFISSGSVRNLFLYVATFGPIFACFVVFQISHNKLFHKYKCFELLYCLQGELTPLEIQIFDKQVIIKVRSRFRLILFLVKISILIFPIIMAFISIVMLVILSKSFNEFLPWIPWFPINFSFLVVVVNVLAYIILSSYIVLYFLLLRTKLFNSKLNSILKKK